MQRILFLVIFAILFSFQMNAQLFDYQFNKAAHKSLKKLERVVKRKTKEVDSYPHFKGDYKTPNKIQALTDWFEQQSSVLDAENDLCAIKTMQYPGYASIGIILETEEDTLEIAYHFQLGETKKWRFMGKDNEEMLVYLSSEIKPGFIFNQRNNCYHLHKSMLNGRSDSLLNAELEEERIELYEMNEMTYYDSLIGTWTTDDPSIYCEIKSKLDPALHVTSIYDLTLKASLSIQENNLLCLGAKHPDLGEYFAQGTWMQACDYYYFIHSFNQNQLLIESQTKQASATDYKCEESHEKKLYELSRKK